MERAGAARDRADYEPWDNAQLLHQAPLPPAGEARTPWRIAIKES